MKTVYGSSPSPGRLRPPDLYEYSIDNYWFKAAGVQNEKLNEPLRGSHSADILIVGGGYTGLSAAYNLRRHFPNKQIVLLEGAFCGYGASGRNGGFLIADDLLHDFGIKDPQLIQDRIEVSFYGLKQVKQVIADHGVDCDLRENGMLNLAFSAKQARKLEAYDRNLRSLGLKSAFLQGADLEAEIKSPRAIAGQKMPHGAILNPAKLVRGMKRVVEHLGVEIRERTVVTRITTGAMILVDTELGEIRAPILVLALNAYGHTLGFFRNRIIPMCTYIVATEPLSATQWDSIGWENRQGLSDGRTAFSYAVPAVDGRIVIGGSDLVYYAGDRLSAGNEKTVTKKIKRDLLTTFPQLEGLKIEHAWGGTTAVTAERVPSVGQLRGHSNIYYGGGYNEGVPTGQTAGRIIADLIAGESNKFTRHYIVNRIIPHLGPSMLRAPGISAVRWFMSRSD